MIPPYINKNAKIYLVAPSFGCTTSPYKERLEKTLITLPKKGHEVIIGPNCFLSEGKCASNTKELRAKEFMNSYESDADVILSVGGGEMMVEILDYIDFEKIKKLPPKWFVGFSDNTNLTFTLTTIAGLTTIYGPCAGAFHFNRYSYDVKACYDMLQGKQNFKGFYLFESKKKNEDPLANYHLTRKKIITPYNYKTSFTGTIIGGNLDILQNLCGTPYDKMKEYAQNHKEGIIFYFEACDLSPLGIKRALLQLKRAGWFTNVKGFLSGRPLCMNQEILGITDKNAVIDVLSNFNVPILLNVDLGHIAPSLPMKNGVVAEVEYKDNNIFITYKE